MEIPLTAIQRGNCSAGGTSLERHAKTYHPRFKGCSSSEKEVPYRCVVLLTPTGEQSEFGWDDLDDFWTGVRRSHAQSIYRDFVGVQRKGSSLVYPPDSPLLTCGEYRLVSRTQDMDDQALFQVLADGVAKLREQRQIVSSSKTIRQLEVQLLLQYNHFSLRHEGNNLTLEDTRHIAELILSSGKRHEANKFFVQQSIRRKIPDAPWEDIIDARNHILVAGQLGGFFCRHAITEALLKKLHWGVMQGLLTSDAQGPAGCYRRVDIKVAGGQPERPCFTDVPALMKRFVETTMVQLDQEPLFVYVARVHSEFQLILPFRGGNGRMGRLIINLILMKHGYPILVLPTALSPMFIRGVEMGHAGDLSLFTRLLAEASFRSLHVYEDSLGAQLLPTAEDLLDVYVVRGIPSTLISP